MTLFMGLQKIAPTILSNESVSKKYSLLQRIRDDSYNEIGTVAGFHIDANNTEYAIVVLDAQYRLNSSTYLSSNSMVTNLPTYPDLTMYEAPETATFNCDKILDMSSSGLTSGAVSHCRSKSFIIDDITYYGQLPTMTEIIKMVMNKTAINNADTSAESYPSLLINTSAILSSTQYNDKWCWIMQGGSSGRGEITKANKSGNIPVFPVLELPNIKTNYLKFTSKNENIVERCTYTTLYNGVSVDANSSYGRASFIFPVSQGKTYVLEFDSSYVDGYHMVYFSDTALNSGDPWDPSYTSMSIGGHKTYTFTSTSDVFWIGIYASANTSSGNITLTNVSLTETKS